ncbi:PucR family transcriptional regulator [Paenibacillus puldeungensis]|uniref:PucR family transcriptional regulator n=1 Tax=Paenibacillus puldeungensis TaxID=696536 RepID=A0ABW3RSS9_9BACL
MHIDLAAIAVKLEQYDPQVHKGSSWQTPLYHCSLWGEGDCQNWDRHTLYLTGSPQAYTAMLEGGCPNILYTSNIAVSTPAPDQATSIILITKNEIQAIYDQISAMLQMRQKLTFDCEKLYNLLFEDRGLQEIVNAAYDMLRNPFALCDLSFVRIATPQQLHPDPVVSEYLNSYTAGYDFGRFYNVYRDKKFFEKVARNNGPMIVKEPDVDEFTYLISHINIQRIPVAFVSVLEYNHPFEDYDIELLDVLSKVISLEMQKSSYSQNIRSQNEYWIYHMLEDHPIPDQYEEGKHFIHEAGCPNHFYIFVISIEEYAKDNTLLKFVKKTLEKKLGFTNSLIYQGSIVVVASRYQNTPITKEELQQLAHLLGDNSLLCGVSRRFEQLREIKSHYLQALKTIELGRKLKPTGEQIMFYEDYALYDLLDHCACPEQLQTFCHPALMNLVKYDETYRTFFTATLHQYLIYNCNQSRTASALHIQRSTLLYRLKKIEEIMNIELEQPSFILHLNMSFKILEFTGAIQKMYL